MCNALAPAEVSRVLVDETNHTMEIIVPDDQLSLAIGRRGQNVRLASQLSGWRLDIVSESKVKEIKDRAFNSLGRLERVSEIQLQTLYNYGIRCAGDLLKTDMDFLAGVPGIGAEVATRLVEDAKRVVKEEAREADDEKQRASELARDEARAMIREAARRQTLDCEEDRIRRVRGVGEQTRLVLEGVGVHFVEDLVDMQDLTGLAEKSGLTAERLDELRFAAARYLERERAGDSVEPSTDEAGPEEDYTPSELLAHLREVEAEAAV